MNGITIEQLQAIAKVHTNVIITQHTLDRFRERGIKIADVFSAIADGEVIEQYPDDYPHPSCLILGSSSKALPLHIVCGTDNTKLWVITAYFPDSTKWEIDNKTRKVVNK